MPARAVALLIACVIPVIASSTTFDYTCDDGSAPNSNGCCTGDQRPACCVSRGQSSSGSSTSCVCRGCAGQSAYTDTQCADATGCGNFLSQHSDTMTVAATMMGCSTCVGTKTYCETGAAGVCDSMYAISPGQSPRIDSATNKLACTPVSAFCVRGSKLLSSALLAVLFFSCTRAFS